MATRIKKKSDSPTVVSFVNLKGGVGKTTTAVNFAAYCGSKGFHVLLIDLDPQTNATLSCMTVAEWQKHADKKGTIANLMGFRQTSPSAREKTAENVVVKNVFKNVDLLPSHLDLFTIDLDLAQQPARETKLRRALKDFLPKYSIVICDCPPNLTIPTQNALAMSTHFAIPVSPDYLSAIGVALLLSRIEELRKDLEVDLECAGIVISRVGRRANFRDMVKSNIRQQFKEKVLAAEISERTPVSEAASKGISVFQTNAQEAIKEFVAVSDELLIRLGVAK